MHAEVHCAGLAAAVDSQAEVALPAGCLEDLRGTSMTFSGSSHGKWNVTVQILSIAQGQCYKLAW